MTRPADTDEKSWAIVEDGLRKMTPEQRFRRAVSLTILAHRFALAQIRREHPDEDSVPVAVKGGWAALVALLGLAVNFLVMRSLASHTHDMNARAARLHVIGDLLGSLAALVAGLVIALGGWNAIDPLASLGICVLIAFSAWRLLRESLQALMEAVPRGLSVEAIGTEMARVEGVRSVHDLHVWTLSGSRTALSAHVVVRSLGDWDRVLHALQQRLQEKFAIDHVTLQPETDVRPLVRR